MKLEVKKHALRQTQDGEWHVTIKVNPFDDCEALLRAPMGARFYTEWTEVDENEEPVERAALRTHTTAAPAAPEPEPPGRSYAFEAVRLCEKPGFQRWCMVEWPNTWRELERAHPEEKAREIVCWQCGVTSRGELREGTEAGERWKRLKLRYEQPGIAA